MPASPGRVLIAVVMSMAAAGCLQPSLQPLFADDSGTLEAGLAGVWRCGGEVWTFEEDPADDGASAEYVVRLVEDGVTFIMKARVGRIGDHVFVDFRPDDIEPEPVVNHFFWWHVIGAHTFGRLSITGERLELRMLDGQWAERFIRATSSTFGYISDDAVVLTAPTPVLQQLAGAFAEDGSAFPVQVVLVRAPGDPAGGSCYSPK